MKFLSIGAISALMLSASCSSNEPVGENNGLKGETTYTAFTISMANSGTRAGDEAEETSDDVEQTISSIRIYIFSGGVLEVKDNPQINEYVTTPVEVTTGEKLVYAVTNSTLGTALDAKVTEGTTTVADFEKELFSSLPNDIAASGNFVMIGSQRAAVLKWTKEEAKENAIKVNVDRASAKVQVKYPADVTVAANVNATFSNPVFTLAQQARQMYVNRGLLYTPLGDAAGGTYAGLVAVPDGEISDFIDAPAAYDKAYSKNKYTAECVSPNPTTGNVTFVVVRLKATPSAVYNNATLTDDDFWVLARNDKKTATWIYASDADYKVMYFASAADANTYKASANLEDSYEATKYSDGMAYYRIEIKSAPESENLNEKYCVLRNNYYRINVTDIKALGAPSAPGLVPEDPTTPLEKDSHIVAEIDVTPWVMKDINESLQ